LTNYLTLAGNFYFLFL